MKVYYLFHSGFLVDTEESYYLFDYWQGTLPPLTPGKPVVVFASHAHHDHYNPEIFLILQNLGVEDIYAVLGKDIPKFRYPSRVPVCKACANQTYPLPHGGQVETLRSTDSGVAYLVTCKEGMIYHAGDLNDWSWDGEPEAENRQMQQNYRQQIQTLQTQILQGRAMDLAFVPLDPRQEGRYADGLLYFLETAQAKRVYPMHFWQQPEIIHRFLTDHPQYQDVIQYTPSQATEQ